MMQCRTLRGPLSSRTRLLTSFDSSVKRRVLRKKMKKQKEEHGPPMEERLGLDDLIRALGEFTMVEEGDLNRSHYYIVLENKRSF